MRHITWEEVFRALAPYDYKENIVYGVPKGGMIAAGFLKTARVTHDPSKANIILDDVVDSGATKRLYESKYPDAAFISLIEKKDTEWLIFPWEADHPTVGAEDSIQQNVVRMLQFIGEDPNREGLKDTPNRIARAWKNELFAGYQQKPEDLLTVFDNDGYNQIVLLKDIEVFSMCEHHLLPFSGVAHVAYIPDKKVIGISKLARLVDMYARRAQIQERLGEQIVGALMEHLQPIGAACVIEAVHMCMRMRGCSKQHPTMVTSSLRGVFFEKPQARQELMMLLK